MATRLADFEDGAEAGLRGTGSHVRARGHHVHTCAVWVLLNIWWNFIARGSDYIHNIYKLNFGACVQNAVWRSYPSSATSFDSTMSNMSWHHIQWWCMLFVSCWNRYADVFQYAFFLIDNRYPSYVSLEIYLCVWIMTWFMIHLRSYHYILCTSICYMLLFHWIAQRLLYLYYLYIYIGACSGRQYVFLNDIYNRCYCL